jgi:hypothetical protein
MFYLNWLFSRRLLVKKVRSARTFFRQIWKIWRWEKCNKLVPTYVLPGL